MCGRLELEASGRRRRLRVDAVELALDLVEGALDDRTAPFARGAEQQVREPCCVVGQRRDLKEEPGDVSEVALGRATHQRRPHVAGLGLLGEARVEEPHEDQPKDDAGEVELVLVVFIVGIHEPPRADAGASPCGAILTHPLACE